MSLLNLRYVFDGVDMIKERDLIPCASVESGAKESVGYIWGTWDPEFERRLGEA